jgi:putative spermidine/putrescine transport system permease protein/spermidine/putrescine transport system permease protein
MSGPNAAALVALQRRVDLGRLGLVAPSLALVGVLLLVPLAWLLVLSLQGEDGAFTLANYLRLAEQSLLETYRTTFEVSLTVTVICALVGYPLAYVLSDLPPRWASLALVAVILPFWTSILVRTYAWMILLQRRGLVNDALQDLGLIDQPLKLAYNFTGTVIGMVHIMLPFFVLPLYATLRSIDRSYLRAAANMGAGPGRAFWTVFFPLSLPGLFAGLTLVFVLCLGFFVTPALLGGGKVIMIAMTIERTVLFYSNWGVAGALGLVLLAVTAGLLALGWAVGRGMGGSRRS